MNEKFKRYLVEAKTPKEPKMLVPVRKKINKSLYEISKKKWPNLKAAIDEIWKALADNGVDPVAEDGEKFEGVFMGEDSDTKIDVAAKGSNQAYSNTVLVLSWYKISDKAWEINTYMS